MRTYHSHGAHYVLNGLSNKRDLPPQLRNVPKSSRDSTYDLEHSLTKGMFSMAT